MTSSRSISRRIEKARSALTERSSCSKAVILGDLGVMGDLGCERVEGVISRLGEVSVGVVFHRNKEARVAPGDFTLETDESTGYPLLNSLGGILIGAGGSRDCHFFFWFWLYFLGVLRLRGVGIDIRRGLTAAVDTACNFLDVSARLRSSFDRRGNRDFVISGDDGGDGSCADKGKVVL